MIDKTKKESFKDIIMKMIDDLDDIKIHDSKDNQKIEKKLQKFNEEILKHGFKISNTNIAIFPIWVEAYYYKKNIFEDETCHYKNSNDFKQFYIRLHKDYSGKNQNYGGVDLNLAASENYYLSFLIKLAYIVNDKKSICSQSEIMNMIYNNIKDKNNKWIKINKFKNTILNNYEMHIHHTKRVFRKNYKKKNNNEFVDLFLASYWDKDRLISYDTLRKYDASYFISNS